ncbi:MAG: extracellular solute-binding protein [Acidimicrobiales bacterium]|jgi:sn-glycerol 3-phosphate transport system substrate-binding protein|nr:extracellular solute-binding protein [Acidimicrobiales bacterium]
MRHVKTGRGIAVVVASLALLGSACGGDGDDGGGGSDGSGGGEAAIDLPPCPLEALDSATQPVEVVVWHTQGARPLATLEALVDEYNASQSKVKVRLESQGASYEELSDKFLQTIPTPDALPAIIFPDDTFTQQMVDSGVVLPAQSCVEADNYDTSGFVEVARNYYTVDGALWPASANLGNILLYYNKDHFEQAGLDPEDPPDTLDEVREYAQAIKDAGVVDTPLVHEFSTWKTEFWLTGAGSSMVDNDNGRGGGDTAAATLEGNAQATELFGWFKGMQDDGLLLPVANVPGAVDQYFAIAQQRASMLVESSTAATSVEAFLGGDTSVAEGAGDVDVSGLNLGAGPFPGMVPGNATQVGGGAWYILNTTPDEVQAAAWDFMKFMNTPAAQADMLVGGSYLPYVQAAAEEPEAAAYLNGDAGLAGSWLKIANDQVLAINPDFPGPLIGPYKDFRDEVSQATDGMIFDGKTPDEALAEAQQTVTASLEEYNASGF